MLDLGVLQVTETGITWREIFDRLGPCPDCHATNMTPQLYIRR
jgi:hypothetical protein